MQGLFSDINNQKENSPTLEDFKDKKIVLLSDEAHHINATTKSGKNSNSAAQKGMNLFGEISSWEDVIDEIYRANNQNLLLEFSATIELSNRQVREKYRDLILFKYDLKEFVKDGFSKNIYLFRSDMSLDDRMLGAIIISVYRQKVAQKHGLNLKPVVLFKAKRTIAESKENEMRFNKLIENLNSQRIERFKLKNMAEIFNKIFKFFDDNSINLWDLSEILKFEFSTKKLISTNNDAELETNQNILNSLEDSNNPIRAIFTVDKLNEGWDVLNLFDIVRLYEGQNSGEKNKEKIGKTTISEAQLIGRGARYYPFVYKDFEVYERKFDSDTQNELKILETLFYHSQNETRYISELKNALNEIGLMDKDEPKTFKLKLKKEFNSIEFLNKKVYKNERIEKSYQNSKLSELVKGKKNFKFYAKSGKIILDRVEFDKISNESEKSVNLDEIKTLNLVEFCGENVMKNAILYNNYFCMRELKKVLPNLKSMEEFVKSKEFLGQFEIDIVGDSPDLDLLSQKEKLKIVIEFLSNLEKEMKANTPKFEGSKEFESKAFMEVFSLEKEIITSPSKDSIYMSGKEWFVYEKFHGTIEEESFISLMKNELASYLKAKYTDFYLVRNERDLAIYSFKDGARFEPDFLLFVKGNDVSYQIFIEPKGGYLLKNDEWKQEFLQEIDFSVENDKFRILGLKFYNESIEKDFKDDFKSKI